MIKDFLRRMTASVGGSGYESGVADIIKNEFEKYSDEVKMDAHYNVTAIMHGDKCGYKVPKILICAHMDEVSLMVKTVEDNGFLKVATNSGLDVRLFPGMEVIIHGKKDIRGIFGAKPPHIQKPGEENKTIPLDELYIDTGLNDASEYITVGDIVTYDNELCDIKNGLVMGKAMDDRAGVGILLSAMQELKKLRFYADVHFAATVQEEIGVKGATMAGYAIAPDIGIAIDVTHASSPDAPMSTGNTVPLDKGISITVGPNLHQKLCEKLCEVADKNNINYVIEACPRPTGTDARALQIAGEGIPSLLLSIPLRYMHTPCEIIDPKTVEGAGKLLALFIASFREDWEQWTSY